MLRRIAISSALSLLFVFTACAQDRPGWTLTWSDEFNGSGIDRTKWGFDTGGNGWGNQEWEYYTDRAENAYVQDGNLVIKAIAESYGGRNYTSARMLTKGKFSQTYGRFEARIQIPFGQGIWPAFWMLGDDIDAKGWPTCGEIDIMENIGKEPAIVHGTVHGPGYSGGAAIGAAFSLPGNARFADAFHVYAVEWDPGALRFYVDDQLYKTVTPSDLPAGKTWVYDHPFFILLNLAVGGVWPGYPDATTHFPQFMKVDYVRVYQRGAKPALQSNGIVNGATFEAGLTPGAWGAIFGTALSNTTRPWQPEDFQSSAMPAQLDGVSVTVNGKPAYVQYVSPGQINFQVPDVAAGQGTVQVTNNGQASDPVQAEIKAFQPAFFLWQGKYAVATRTDFSLVAKQNLFSGVTTTPAKPGEIVILWGTGFGPTDPAVPAGQLVSGANKVVYDPAISIAGIPARYYGAALSPTFAGLYQIAVEVPKSAPDGDAAIIAQVGGSSSSPQVYLTVASN